MIVTRNWLNEWIDLGGIDAEKLCKTFNEIGLEVDALNRVRMPEKIVIGKVLECEKHPDAEKLNVCQVDTGEATPRQIVCGASNVAAGQWVCCAVEGAVMPQGMEIKPVKLRGVDSAGMICSSTELGLPKLENGILVLDESVTNLEVGKPLSGVDYFNDDVIEIELTANRGDCLSIRGVARDLSAALDRPLRDEVQIAEDETRKGVGRLLQLDAAEDAAADVSYHILEIEAIDLPLCMALRLGWIDELRPDALAAWLQYVTHCTGVILRAYPVNFFKTGEEKGMISLKRDEQGVVAVYGQDKASLVGISQREEATATAADRLVVIEASYIDPDAISQQMAQLKLKSDPLYYRTSRGSEPELSRGVNYLIQRLEHRGLARFYGGALTHTRTTESRVVSMDKDYIARIVGAPIEGGRVVQLLKNLGFDLSKSQEERFIIGVPPFRHDIVNRQDIAEEIVRMVGIDNIAARPLQLVEADRCEADYYRYQKQRRYRQCAAQSGFYESVHFVFHHRERLEAYGFDCTESARELLNPITGTLDTLRPTLLAGLLDAASLNAKNGQKQIMLFESGMIFDPQRNEMPKIALLFAGECEPDTLDNAGKPDDVDFARFTRKVAEVVGDMTLESHTCTHKLAHPYQSAAIRQGDTIIGELFRLHPNLQEALDLPVTYLCEIDFDALPYGLVKAETYSKFQASHRDLSLVMPQTLPYARIAEVIETGKQAEVIRFYPVDRYQDESMGELMSLTVRFVLRSEEKTLEEEEITSAMDGILAALNTELGVTLR